MVGPTLDLRSLPCRPFAARSCGIARRRSTGRKTCHDFRLLRCGVAGGVGWAAHRAPDQRKRVCCANQRPAGRNMDKRDTLERCWSRAHATCGLLTVLLVAQVPQHGIPRCDGPHGPHGPHGLQRASMMSPCVTKHAQGKRVREKCSWWSVARLGRATLGPLCCLLPAPPPCRTAKRREARSHGEPDPLSVAFDERRVRSRHFLRHGARPCFSLALPRGACGRAGSCRVPAPKWALFGCSVARSLGCSTRPATTAPRPPTRASSPCAHRFLALLSVLAVRSAINRACVFWI